MKHSILSVVCGGLLVLVGTAAAAVLALALFPALTPDGHAQGRGVVEGRLLNRTQPGAPVSGAEVDAISLGGGMSVVKSAKTGPDGSFRLEGLSPEAPLMIRAAYAGVTYHGHVEFDAAGKASIELGVYETTNSWAGIEVEGVRMAFQLEGDKLRSLESVTFENKTSPPRAYMNDGGNFRFSKAPGIDELPRLSVTGPGSTMPVTQPMLESADGQSYYSLYALRPGMTTFDVEQALPYAERRYTYRKRFQYDVEALQVGVIPADMEFSGEGLSRTETDPQRNFAVYSGGPFKAGTEVVWTFGGGTPVSVQPPAGGGAGSRVTTMPNRVSRHAMVVGPLLLVAFFALLWFGSSAAAGGEARAQELRNKRLKERREQLVEYVATLDHRFDNHQLEQGEYTNLRERGVNQLRRVQLMLDGK